MTRRALRESIFRILFRVEFNSIDEMKEQIDSARAEKVKQLTTDLADKLGI